jgi:uncharacterized phage-associated protein
MPAPYPVVAIVDWFIRRNQSDQMSLTHLKIQKLLYFAQGHHLARFDEPLFDENFQAWRYGPVVVSVYHQLKDSGDNEIKTPLQDQTLKSVVSHAAPLAIDEDDWRTIEFLESFWPIYAPLKPWGLVSLANRDNGPWRKIAEAVSSWKTESRVVPTELLRQHFSSHVAASPPPA